MLAKQKIKRYMGFVSLVFVFLLILSTDAQAEMYAPWWEWGVVENNSGDIGDISEQFSINVTDAGSVLIGTETHNQALFTITNSGDVPSSITGVYFEDGTILKLAEILYFDTVADDLTYSGIFFTQPPHPQNMPGWSTLDPKFYATSSFSVTTNGSPDGVNPGESFGIKYTLTGDKTLANVIEAINTGFEDPGLGESLRIGLRIQSVYGNDGDSDSLILTPIPASVVLGMLGLGVVGLKLRKYA